MGCDRRDRAADVHRCGGGAETYVRIVIFDRDCDGGCDCDAAGGSGSRFGCHRR